MKRIDEWAEEVCEALGQHRKRGTPKVYKSNMLIEANYKLKLVEHRIILSCIAKLYSYEAFPDEIKLTAGDYAKTFKTSLKRSYEALANGSVSLHKRTLALDGLGFRWLDGPVEYMDSEGAIVLCFSQALRPHLTQLRGCFTAYELEKVSSLKKVGAIRLYEQLMQWRSSGELLIRVEDFKQRLGLESKYKDFRKLKEWVIDPAVKELDANSGVTIQYTLKRRGNRPDLLRFKFEERDISNLARFPYKPSCSGEEEPSTSTPHKG